MSAYLIARSVLAKTHQGAHGPDILITASTKIGRNVNGQGACRLPPKWAQVSGNHCRVYYDEEKDPSGYWIEDTSTNGTLVNGERITKGSSVPVKEGDVVQLSWNAAGDAAGLLEYVFEKDEGAGKRSRSASAALESPEGKRNRNSNDSDALLKSVANLEQSNQELRKKLEVERSQKEQLERRLQTVTDEIAVAMEAAKRDATAAQQQAQATAEKEAETAGAALQAAQTAAAANESRAVEAEEQLAEKEAGLEEAVTKLTALQRLQQLRQESYRLEHNKVDLSKDVKARTQGTYDAAHEHEGNLTKEVEALKEQVEALQTSAAAAAQETASLEGRLAEAAATNTAQAEAFLKQSEDLQEAASDTASAKSTAEQAAAAAVTAQAAEQAAVTARQAAEAEVSRLQPLLEEAQRATERAGEQQHNAEEQLSVKQALLTSMAQRFAQVEEGKRRAAQLHAQASRKIAEADNALHALGQELMYAAEGRLQSNSGTRTAMQDEASNGGATEGAAGKMEEDATAILAMHNEVTQQENPVPVQQSPTLSLQLNRGNTQRTVAEQPLEETQENEAQVAEPGRADRAASTASQASASTSPSAASSSRGVEGNENVDNNSMDYGNASNRQMERKSGVSAVTLKMQPTEADGMAPTMVDNASLAFQLPDHAPSGGMDGHNTVDEFDGME